LTRKLGRETLYAKIAEEIRGMIERGALQPGDRLPPLATIAVQFSCSRATVREALSSLRGQGLVEFRHGDGTYVQSAGVEMWMEPLDAAILLGRSQLKDLLDMQIAILAGIATTAARKRPFQDYSRLSRALFDLECSQSDPEQAVTAELAFYVTLSEVAGNAVLENALRTLQEALRSSLRLLSTKQSAGFKTCLQVYEAIQKEDEVVARNALYAYGREIEKQFTTVRGNR
jgi:GntR family transcriptional regulator, transcriptional repressor for pyruvate dehydrogenase complex